MESQFRFGHRAIFVVGIIIIVLIRPLNTEQKFLTPEDCLAAGETQEICQATYNSALAEHKRYTPRFASKEECESKIDVSQCVLARVRRWDGRWGGEFADMFVPEMAGYMVKYSRGRRRSLSWLSRDSNAGYAVETHFDQGDYWYGDRHYKSGPLYLSRDRQELRRLTQLTPQKLSPIPGLKEISDQ